MTEKPTQRIVRSVDRAIDVLELLARTGQPMSLAEIFRAVQTPKSTTLNIVRTLVQRRILELDQDSKKYKAGHLLLALAGHAHRSIDLGSLARPYLHQLVESTRESALLGVIEQDEMVYLDAVNSSEPIRYVAQVGTRRLLHANSGGKLALALEDEATWDAYIERTKLPAFTDTTVVDADKLRAQLREIRRLGYAVSYGETVPDVIGIAAPLFQGPRGKLLGVLVVAAPAYRGRRNLKAILKHLRPAATALTKLLV